MTFKKTALVVGTAVSLLTAPAAFAQSAGTSATGTSGGAEGTPGHASGNNPTGSGMKSGSMMKSDSMMKSNSMMKSGSGAPTGADSDGTGSGNKQTSTGGDPGGLPGKQ